MSLAGLGVPRRLLTCSGAHVSWRADDGTRRRAAGSERFARDGLGQTEIADMWLIVRIDQDVRRFQIAMKDAMLVCMMNRATDGGEIKRAAS